MLRYILLSLFALSSLLSQAQKPNILLIYTDQQRYNTIRSLGNDEIHTPNLDQLIKEGTAFTHAFVTAPVCVPSRWSLHTGMYTTSHQTYSNHHVSKELRPETSLPEELRNVGYKTAVVGKNHCFLNKKRVDIMDGGAHNNHRPADGRSADKAGDWSVEADDMHGLTNRTIELFEENEDQPLFVWLSYLYPHTPFICPEPYFSMYDTMEIDPPAVEKKGLKKAGKPFRQQYHQINNTIAMPYDMEKTMRMKRTYYGMVSMIDAEIGRLLDYLEENNLRENTIIVFTSDHGDYQGDHGLYTKSPAMYDCLTRVPLIFSYPEIVKQNQIRNDLVSSTDIMPTLLDMAELPIPFQVQGNSLVPELKNEKSSTDRQYAFSEYGIPGEPILEDELKEKMPDYKEVPVKFSGKMPWEANPVGLSGRFRMIRSQDYKLVEEVGGTNELYDLKKDPNELVNVYGKRKYQAIQEEMLQALHKWKKTLPGIERENENMGQENFEKYLKRRNKK